MMLHPSSSLNDKLIFLHDHSYCQSKDLLLMFTK